MSRFQPDFTKLPLILTPEQRATAVAFNRSEEVELRRVQAEELARQYNAAPDAVGAMDVLIAGREVRVRVSLSSRHASAPLEEI